MMLFEKPKKIRRILVARGDALGDMVLATAVIRPLLDLFPDAEIYFLARHDMVSLLSGIPEVAGVIENNLSYAWSWSDLPTFFSLCKKICDLAPDMFFGLWEKRRYAFLSFFAKVPMRIGYSVSLWNRILYTHVVPVDFSFFFTHQIRHNVALLNPFLQKDTELSDAAVAPYIGCPSAWRTDLYVRYPLLRDVSYVSVQVDGSAMQKTWLPETALAVVRYLAKKYDYVVLLGIPNEERLAVLSVGLSDCSNVLDLTNRLSLPDVVSVLSRSSLFVGLDSGFAHLAAALRVPSVVYFLNRTQNALRWAPWGSAVHLVFSRHTCPDRCVPSVCEKRTCREMLLFDELRSAIDRVFAGVSPSPYERLRQLAVGVISRNPEVWYSFFSSRDVSCLVLSPDLKVKDMFHQLSERNVMFVLLDNEHYGFSYRLVRVLVSNQVMWPPVFVRVNGISDALRFLQSYAGCF